MIVEAIQWAASRVNGWALGVLQRRIERKMLKLFPVGARVRFLPSCDCGRRALASGTDTGTVEGLTSGAFDYRVNLDLPGQHDFEFLCPKGMVRA